MLTDLFIYSLRNLWTRRLRTALTMIGIVIGIMAVIALVGLGNGLKEAVTNQFNLFGPDVVSISASGGGNGPPGFNVPDPLVTDYISDLDRLSSVETAVGSYMTSVFVEVNDIQELGLVQSLPDDQEKLDEYIDMLSIDIDHGRFLKAGERGKVVVGYDIYANSDQTFGKNIDVGQKILLNGKSFELVGVLKKKGSFIIDGSIRLSEVDTRDLGNDDESYNIISVRAKSRDLVSKTKQDIEKYLRDERDVKVGEEDFSVETSESSLNNLNSILTGIQVFIVLIAVISMIVGAIGIVNTMFTAVVERTKEIGIMKAIGAKNNDIFALFFIESGLLGMIGGALGILLGWLIARAGTAFLAAFFSTNADPAVSVSLVISSLIGSFVIGSLSGIVPAMQAANLRPVKALRGN